MTTGGCREAEAWLVNGGGRALGRKALPKHAVCLMRVGDLDLEKISWHVGPSPYLVSSGM